MLDTIYESIWGLVFEIIHMYGIWYLEKYLNTKIHRHFVFYLSTDMSVIVATLRV